MYATAPLHVNDFSHGVEHETLFHPSRFWSWCRGNVLRTSESFIRKDEGLACCDACLGEAS